MLPKEGNPVSDGDPAPAPLDLDDVDRFLLEAVDGGSLRPTLAATERFGLTRQAVSRRLRRLIDGALLTAEGSTRARRYALAVRESQQAYSLLAPLDEHRVWREFAQPSLGELPTNVVAICAYGFTEMLNNAIDHSQGTGVLCQIRASALRVEMTIQDDGIGVFRKIREFLQLADEREAILELAKGKLTTAPEDHTGDGLFFASRMFDRFVIVSGSLHFTQRPNATDYLLEDVRALPGTLVAMEIARSSQRTTKSVFDRFASTDGTYRFTTTLVPVSLAQVGDDQLVSRSQAKRLLARLDKFERVQLDFTGVATIGPAFADEIFRVYRKAHPAVELSHHGANEQVSAMIARALSTQSS